MPCGYIYQEMLDILNAQEDKAMTERIWRQMNYSYHELCASVSWRKLRVGTPLSLDFATATATGLWLPSDLLGIDLVWDATNKVVFWPHDKPEAQPSEGVGYRYFTYTPSPPTDFFPTAAYTGGDLVLDKGGSTFTSASLTASGLDPEGEYVQFDDEAGIYEITNSASPFAFRPAYHGESLASAPFVIRPSACTEKMCLVDEEETLLYDRTVSVYYWRAPAPLYRESDYTALPSLEILKLKTLRSIPESKQKFPISERALEEAMRLAVSKNPKFRRPLAGRDIRGNQLFGSTNPYGSR